LIGYGDIAKRLYADPKTKREGNIYWKWIETYVADDYSEAVRVGSGKSKHVFTLRIHLWIKALLEKNAVLQSPSRIEELVKIFIHATNVSLSTLRRC
jgi:thiaminase